MSRLRSHARWSDDRGATAVEYGVVVALIAIAVVVAVALLGSNLLGSFTNSNDAIENAVNGVPAVEAAAQPANNAPAAQPANNAPAAQPANNAPAATYATWQRVGQSDNYRWVCANNFNLGAAGRPVERETPSGAAPACQ